MFSLFCFGLLVYAESPRISAEKAYTQAKTSFTELSDISRNVSKLLEEARRKRDSEQEQCISARQVSIATLMEFSKKSIAMLGQNSLPPLMAETELEKIRVALRSASQYRDEVETCLASAKSQSADQGSTLNFTFDDSKIFSSIETDESEFATDTIENNVSQSEASTSTSAESSGGLESEASAPPPASSPYQ